MLAALLLGWALARVGLGYPPRDDGCRRLRRAERALLASVAEAVFPPGGAIACSGLDAGIPRYVDGLIARTPPRPRRLMRLLFLLFEHATLVFPAPGGLRGRRRFSSLDLAQRIALLEAWAASRSPARRLVFGSLRAIVTLGYFAHPPVLQQLGLAPWVIAPPVVEADLLYPRVGAHPDAIAWTRDDLTPARPVVPLDPGGERLSGTGADAT
ncbi:MAG TPA: gluconate 2-dehydrogenase subunit 3 family protein [Myxococcota bacterium]